jgi:UDP-N-acetylglucosamine acyltransferase
LSRIHATAIVDPSAQLADDVEVGPYAIIEGDVQVGPGCRIGAHAILCRYTVMGEGNVVDHHAVIGGLPQDLSFDPTEVTHVRIGEHNIFREHVTISRATVAGGATVVGNKTYWMAGSHAGHDAVIEDGVILTNNVMIGGHAHIGTRAVLGGGSAVHQFCRVGERAMFQGNSATGMHVPPYTLHVKVSRVAGLNHVGIRRAENITSQDHKEIKQAFALLYRRGLTPAEALVQMDDMDWGEPARRFVEFVRKTLSDEGHYHRGICPLVDRVRRHANAASRPDSADTTDE